MAFSFSAIPGSDLSFGSSLSLGESFVIPGGDRAEITVKDNDDYLSGDKWWANGFSADRSQQRADIDDGAGGSHSVGRVMIERVHIVEDAAGNQYTLLQIDVERRFGPDSNDFYTFSGPVPPEGAQLTVVDQFNAGTSDYAYADLSADTPQPSPVAVDDNVATDEDNAISGNVLDNDQYASTAFVSSVAGGAVGTPVSVTSTDGRTGTLTVMADGSFTFDPDGGFEDMKDGETDTVAVDVTIAREIQVTELQTRTVDFEGLSAGDVVSGQIAGMTISGDENGGWPWWDRDNDAMVFDADNPTGGDDDLGVAGQGNMLIVSEDNDSSDPDAARKGGTLTFDFDAPTRVESLTFIDIEKGAWIKAYDDRGKLIDLIQTGRTGDGELKIVDIDLDGVSKLEVRIKGSGAVDDLVLTEEVEVTKLETSTATLSVAVAGAQDVATISGPAAIVVKEDVLEMASQYYTVVDPDAGEAGLQPGSVAGTHGLFTITPSGNVYYELYNLLPEIQGLAEGEEVTDEVVLTSIDGSATYTVTGRVLGTNDAPQIHLEAGDRDSATLTETDEGLAVQAALTFYDIDTKDIVTASVVGLTATGTVPPLPPQSELLSMLTIQADPVLAGYETEARRAWLFDSGDEAFDDLNEGETLTLTYRVEVFDGYATATHDITININGTNDNTPPVATIDSFSMVEDTYRTFDLAANDVDLEGDTLQIASINGQAVNLYDSVVLSSGATIDVRSNGLVEYNPATDWNGSDSFTYTVTDGEFESNPSTVSVYVQPRPDAAELVGDFTGSVKEDTTTSFTRQIQVIDPDAGEDKLRAETFLSDDGLGQVTVSEDGTVTYSLLSQLVQSLGEGDTRQDSFSVTSLDGQATETFSVTIEGTNDAAQVQGDTAASIVATPVTTVLTGKLTVNDIDQGEDYFLTNVIVQPSYGTFAIDASGNWSFKLDDTAAFIREMTAPSQGGAGISLFSTGAEVSTADGTRALVNFVIQGFDDPAVIVPGWTGAQQVVEAGEAGPGVPVVSGFVDVIDPDSAVVLPTMTSTVTYGTMTFNPVSSERISFEYTLDNSSPATQALNEGDTAYETVTATFADGRVQTFLVEILGKNDAGQVNVALNGATPSVVEDGLTYVAPPTATISVTDVDANEAFLDAPIVDSEGGYAVFEWVAPDNWTIDLDDSAVQDLSLNEVVWDKFILHSQDGSGSAELDFRILGTNDAPVVVTSASTLTGQVQEAGVGEPGQPDASGQVVAEDVDRLDTLTYSGDALTTYGQFTVDAVTGEWDFVLNDASPIVQSLQVGETRDIDFTVAINDGQGQSNSVITETVTVTIHGANDGPVGSSAALSTEYVTTLNGQVPGTDPEMGVLSYAVLPGFGVENGTLVLNPDGSFDYTPNADFTGTETFAIQITDDQGETAVSTVSVDVGPNTDVLVGDSKGGEAEVTNTGQVTVDLSSAGGAEGVNVMFMLDSSGSVGSAGWDIQKQAVVDTVLNLAGQFSGSQTDLQFSIISFSSQVELELRFPNGTNPSTVAAVVAGLPFQSGVTRTGDAVRVAYGEFSLFSEPGDVNYAYLITDGIPYAGGSGTAQQEDLLTQYGSLLKGLATVEAFGVGTQFAPNTPNIISQTVDSDGIMPALTGFSDLADALQASPLFAIDIASASVSLSVDGVDLGEVADETAFSGDQNTQVLDLAAITDLAEKLGEANTFTVTTTLDYDGNLATTADQRDIVTVETLGRAPVAVNGVGTDSADLIFGSNEDDTLAGGDGDDIIMSFAGNDQVQGDAGADTFVFTSTTVEVDILDYEAGIDQILLQDNMSVAEVNEIDIGADGVIDAMELVLSNGGRVVLAGQTDFLDPVLTVA